MDNKVALATFGGGCFWCIEAIIQQLKGVKSVVSGYAGGDTDKPNYQQVCSGKTGHAEVVQVAFDPQLLSYKDLIEVFMTSHNPTQRNGQGADIGTQYRSIILYHDPAQKADAQAIFSELATTFPAPIVTELVELQEFYPAEQKHQDYYNNNSGQGYCQVVISPKLQKLRQNYADKLTADATQQDKKPHQVRHLTKKNQYLVALEEGYEATLTYQKQGKVLAITHTLVPAELRGKGYGSVLMENALKAIEQDGFKVKPICSYAVRYLEKHKEWKHLLAEA